MPIKIKSLALAAALTLSANTANAQLLPPIGQTLPNLLTAVGGVANPLLQPILGNITGPLVGGLVPQLVPQVSGLLGGLLAGPLNLVEDLPLGAINGRGGLMVLPPLKGLE